MPIRPEFRKFYGREWREVTRPHILKRAKNRCEQCKKPNRKTVLVRQVGQFIWWRPASGRTFWRDVKGRRALPPMIGYRKRTVRVVLTIAHLNHTPGHDSDDNLKALCQWCHLNYDKLHHKLTRTARKDAARPLLQEAS